MPTSGGYVRSNPTLARSNRSLFGIISGHLTLKMRLRRVDKCLNLLQHCLCLQQNKLHGVEDAKLGSHADHFGGPDVLEHDKGCSCFADPGYDISVHAPCRSIALPRQKKESTSLMGSPPTVTGMLAVELIFISSVFFLLILSPVPGGGGGTLDFKWRGWSKDFLGLKFSIPGYFGFKKLACIFLGSLIE